LEASLTSDIGQLTMFEPNTTTHLFTATREQQRNRRYYLKSARFKEKQINNPHTIRSYARDMPLPTDTHVLAYLAGIVDGEGCISIYGDGRTNKEGRGTYRLSLAIAMQHKPVLELFVATFGGTIYLVHKNLAVHTTPYWRIPYMCNRAAQVIHHIRPYMRIKTEQADLAILFQTTRLRRKGLNFVYPIDYWDEADRMKARMSELNHQDSVSLRRLIQGSS
jgi:hypothetical protein